MLIKFKIYLEDNEDKKISFIDAILLSKNSLKYINLIYTIRPRNLTLDEFRIKATKYTNEDNYFIFIDDNTYDFNTYEVIIVDKEWTK